SAYAPERAPHRPGAGALDRRPVLPDGLVAVPPRARPSRVARRLHGNLAVLRPAPVRGRLLGECRALELRGSGAAWQLLPAPAEGASVLHRQHRLPSRAPPQRTHPQLQPAARPRGEFDLSRSANAVSVGRPASRAAQALGREPRAARHLPSGTTGEWLTG